MTQELRKLAEATKLDWGWYDEKSLKMDIGNDEDAAYIAAANPAAILSLLDRLEKAEKDAEFWGFIRRHWKAVNFRFMERPNVISGFTLTVSTHSNKNEANYIEREITAAMEANK